MILTHNEKLEHKKPDFQLSDVELLYFDFWPQSTEKVTDRKHIRGWTEHRRGASTMLRVTRDNVVTNIQTALYTNLQNICYRLDDFIASWDACFPVMPQHVLPRQTVINLQLISICYDSVKLDKTFQHQRCWCSTKCFLTTPYIYGTKMRNCFTHDHITGTSS